MKIVEIGGLFFGIDPISRFSLNQIRNRYLSASEQVDAICREQTRRLPPEFVWEEARGGVPPQLAETILDISGFGSIDGVMRLREEAVQWARTDEARLNGLIMYVFASMDLDKVESLSPDRWHYYVALAEAILMDLLGIDPTLYLDEKAKMKAIQRAQREQQSAQAAQIYGPSKIGGRVTNAWTPQGGISMNVNR